MSQTYGASYSWKPLLHLSPDHPRPEGGVGAAAEPGDPSIRGVPGCALRG